MHHDAWQTNAQLKIGQHVRDNRRGPTHHAARLLLASLQASVSKEMVIQRLQLSFLSSETNSSLHRAKAVK